MLVHRSLPIASGGQLLLLSCAVVAQARIVADGLDDPGDPISLCNLGIEVLSAPVLSELLDDLVARFVVLSSAELKYVA